MILVDHTEPRWQNRYVRTHAAAGRENGAATYSRELVKYQVPVIEDWLKNNGLSGVVSTCPLLSQTGEPPMEKCDVAIQYLHTYTREDPTREARHVVAFTGSRAKRTIFITSYKILEYELAAAGFDVLYIPASVDVGQVRAAAAGVEKHGEKRVIYFGNATPARAKMAETLRSAFNRLGWQFDIISRGLFNGREIVDQKTAWRKIAAYEYGIGVGRCALEMGALGLKVMVAGSRFGGIITSEHQWWEKLEANLSGANVTFSHDPRVCIRHFDKALIHTFDCNDAAQVLNEKLKQFKV